MNPIRSAWFWLLLLSLLGLLLSFIFFEIYGTLENGVWTYPGWIWGLFAVSIALFAISFILFAIASQKSDCDVVVPACEVVEARKPCKKVKFCEPEKKSCPEPEKIPPPDQKPCTVEPEKETCIKE